MKSPCNNICKLNKKKNICIECFRKDEEILNWQSLSILEKQRIISELPKRKKNKKIYVQN